MTRVIWTFIKDKLIFPYLDLDIKYYDLGMEYRVETVESGKMTKDLALTIYANELKEEHKLTTEEFLEVLNENLKAKMN